MIRYRRRRGFAVISLFAALVLVVSGCRGPANPDTDADLLSISRDYMATTLNPAINPSDATLTLNYLETPTAIRRDAHGVPSVEPSLASRWAQIDARTWRFTVRDGVEFSDGEALDAQAFKYSIELIQDRSDGLGPLFADYRIDVVDDMTFDVVSTAGPDALIPQQLSWLFVFPPDYTERVGYEAFGTDPVGTGPYEVTGFTAGRSVSMRENPRYWGDAPGFPRLQVNLESDPFTRVATVEAGDAQVGVAIAPSQFDRVRSSPVMQFVSSPGDTSLYLQQNVTAPPLNDPRVAEAVSLAIDRESLVEHVFDGEAVAFDSLFYPTMLDGLASDLQGSLRPDRERARELVEAAGPAAEAPIQLIGSADVPEAADILQIVQAELAEVGLSSEIRIFDTADAYFSSWVAGGTPGIVLAINELIWPDPALLFDGFFAPDSLFAPLGAWPEVTDLAQTARAETTNEGRIGPYRDLQSLVLGRHHAYLSLLITNEVDAVANGITVPRGGGTFAEVRRLS